MERKQLAVDSDWTTFPGRRHIGDTAMRQYASQGDRRETKTIGGQKRRRTEIIAMKKKKS